MNETTNIVRFRQPDTIDDPLTDILRAGARKLLAQAIEIEAGAFLGYCQVGAGSGLWQGLGHEHNVQPVPRLPLSG